MKEKANNRTTPKKVMEGIKQDRRKNKKADKRGQEDGEAESGARQKEKRQETVSHDDGVASDKFLIIPCSGYIKAGGGRQQYSRRHQQPLPRQ